MAERTLFLSSLGAAMLVAVALEWCFAASTARSRRADTLWVGVVTACVALALASRTALRTSDWRNDATLMEASLSLYPLNAMSLYGRGAATLKTMPAHTMAQRQANIQSAEVDFWRAALAHEG